MRLIWTLLNGLSKSSDIPWWQYNCVYQVSIRIMSYTRTQYKCVYQLCLTIMNYTRTQVVYCKHCLHAKVLHTSFHRPDSTVWQNWMLKDIVKTNIQCMIRSNFSTFTNNKRSLHFINEGLSVTTPSLLPGLWNNLPHDMHKCYYLHHFKNILETILFKGAFLFLNFYWRLKHK